MAALLLARRHLPKKKRKGRTNRRRMIILSGATTAASSRGAIFQIATSAVPRALNATYRVRGAREAFHGAPFC
jgi:ribosomal protein L20